LNINVVAIAMQQYEHQKDQHYFLRLITSMSACIERDT